MTDRPAIPDYVDMKWPHCRAADLIVTLNGYRDHRPFNAVKRGEYAMLGWCAPGEEEKIEGNFELRWKDEYEAEQREVERRRYEDEISRRAGDWPTIFRGIRRLMPKSRRQVSNQEIAMQIFNCGATYGWNFCNDHGIDADARS